MMAWQCAKLQIEHGESWVLRTDEDETVAIGGLWPNEDGTAEGWFMCTKQAKKHLRLIVRLIRLTLPRSAYPAIDVVVITKAGARIANFCGLSRVEKRDGMEIWRYGRTTRGRREKG
jgi:hypothetical protein